MRVSSYLKNERKEGREPIFDLEGIMMNPPNPGPHAGVPLGGIGSGSIGREITGDFQSWKLWPGKTEHKRVFSDQFFLRINRQNPSNLPNNLKTKNEAVVLSTETKSNTTKSMKKLNWGMNPSKLTFCAVFPRSWHVYDQPLEGVSLCCRQISPIFPHKCRETCLPTAVFV
mmetsp:Transcript_579/g.806  ORF Transcript_579/g.806 Transcript_579/m.806 type:complete len:171 (-) Transcript_579:221-733(-)